MRRSRTAHGDYGQTVRVMNKTDKSNVIENIFLDLVVPIFFGRWRHLAANHFSVFYGQTVGVMNKSHKYTLVGNTFLQFRFFYLFW